MEFHRLISYMNVRTVSQVYRLPDSGIDGTAQIGESVLRSMYQQMSNQIESSYCVTCNVSRNATCNIHLRKWQSDGIWSGILRWSSLVAYVKTTDCIFHFEVLQCTNNSGEFSLCLQFIRAKYGAELSANKQTQTVWQQRTKRTKGRREKTSR